MIYLMRHGLDDENYIGGYSNVELVDEGIKQVEKSTNVIKNLKINKIVCSDVLRAKQTADIVNSMLKLPIITDTKLRELDKGLLNGMEKEIAKDNYPYCFGKLSIYDKYPNGEAMIDLYNRIKILLNEIIKYDESLIVTHRGVINMIYYLLNNIDLDMDKEKFNVNHASIHELDISNKKIRRIY